MSKQTYVIGEGRSPEIKRNMLAFIDRLDMSKAWRVTIEPEAKKRSKKQLGALWGVAYPAICEHFGYRGKAEIEHLHMSFCGDFFGWRDIGLGERMPVRTTSTDERGEKNPITAEVMAELYNHVQRKAAEFGCDVPDPDPHWYLQ